MKGQSVVRGIGTMNHKEVKVEYYYGTVNCNDLWTIVIVVVGGKNIAQLLWNSRALSREKIILMGK